MYARVVVALRYPLVVGWIAAMVAAVVLLPGLSGSSTAPLDDIMPTNAKALTAEGRALQLFGSTVATDVAVVQRNPRGLRREEIVANLRLATSVQHGGGRRLPGVRAAVPLVNAPAPGVRWGERGTTALTYLFLSPDLNLVERDDAARRYSAALGPPAPGSTRGITGAGPARLQQFESIDEALPWMELATILVILVIVAIYFRSIGAPLVTLATGGIAYVIGIRVLAWAGQRAGVTAPSEIEPVLVVLLLGLVTDYTVFFMSETRRRLLRGEPRVVAARRATARIAPIVLTAGLLVAAGSASLLAGKMEFFRVFGPALAVSALTVTVVCVTLVPAVLALLGPRLFGRSVRAAQDAPPRGAAVMAGSAVGSAQQSERRDRWRLRFGGPLGALRASRRGAVAEGGRVAPRFVTRLLTARPLAIVLAALCIGVLAVAALGARSSHLAVAFLPSLPKSSEARQAGDAAQRAFVPGVLSPTDVIIEQPGVATRSAPLRRLQALLASQPGVAAVLGPAQSSGTALQRFVVSRGGGAARFVLLLADEPTGARAINTITRLQDRMPALQRQAGLPVGARVAYAGETALAKETVDALAVDLRRVAIATAVLTFLLLALFLRALVAPLLLLLGTVLAFAGSFGLTALLLPHTVGGTDVVYYVPLVAAVLLVGLGSDYNVFMVGRIRGEARRRRLREAIAVGAPAASQAITVAGITLASTFALLAIVPLRPFRELALLMTIGVLVDALLVRPLLIPTLIAVVGRFAWWPSHPSRPPDAQAFLEEVAARSGQSVADARIAVRETLCTLAERVPVREARELALRLPQGLVPEPDGASSRGEPFDAEEFVARVARRSGVSPATAERDARAVLATVADALPQEEVDYIRAVLSDDYRSLWSAEPEPPPPAGRPRTPDLAVG
ncbi:MAG TPA: MMPL family transporter [Baekduia sp.]|nr:MMPL family transporter [Baekduia sp.]